MTVVSSPSYTVENYLNGKRHEVTSKQLHIVMGHKVLQQWDDFANHRLVACGKVGEWTGYEFPCILKTPIGTFCGTTDYWSGTFPPVFQIRTRARER